MRWKIVSVSRCQCCRFLQFLGLDIYNTYINIAGCLPGGLIQIDNMKENSPTALNHSQ